MFLKCSYFFQNLSLDVLINKVLIQSNACIRIKSATVGPTFTNSNSTFARLSADNAISETKCTLEFELIYISVIFLPPRISALIKLNQLKE